MRETQARRVAKQKADSTDKPWLLCKGRANDPLSYYAVAGNKATAGD